MSFYTSTLTRMFKYVLVRGREIKVIALRRPHSSSDHVFNSYELSSVLSSSLTVFFFFACTFLLIRLFFRTGDPVREWFPGLIRAPEENLEAGASPFPPIIILVCNHSVFIQYGPSHPGSPPGLPLKQRKPGIEPSLDPRHTGPSLDPRHTGPVPDNLISDFFYRHPTII